ncbi:hypothetical protein [Haladaptatus sp. DFWS20]|uniref:hypothetical protein n=1 Tax=Haladaptatus sp. DFWS20 TaxID=3403467 RepID=UPI003EB8BAE7
MSNSPPTSTVEEDSDQQAETISAEELAAQVELLTEENQRLRDEYRRARQASHRRTALGMAGLGTLAGLGGILFPSSQSVLFALAGTGLFIAVLTYFLTPEQFVSAAVGERTYAAHAKTGAELIDSLGLSEHRLYLPTEKRPEESDGNGGIDGGIRLFVPHHREYGLPDSNQLKSMFVVTADERQRGITLPPTGAGLFDEFESMVDDPASELPELAAQLADALVEGFELVENATPEVDIDGEQVTIGISGSRYGGVKRFDHPVASFIAVGLAREMQQPVTLETTTTDDDRTDYVIRCSVGDNQADGQMDNQAIEQADNRVDGRRRGMFIPWSDDGRS